MNVEIQLVMTDRTLFDGDQESAVLTGYGPLPAPVARHLVRSADPATRAWIRRLHTDPDTGRLAGADTRRRFFSHSRRQLLIARDQVCRTPWCGAPIQHADHTVAYASGGPTDTVNGAGLCADCNRTKEQPGWTSTTQPGGDITVTTPTGHTYRSRPPDPPRSATTGRPRRLTTHRSNRVHPAAISDSLCGGDAFVTSPQSCFRAPPAAIVRRRSDLEFA